MPLDRSAIQRSDFPTSRRGYEPSAVDAHLRAVADEVEGMRRPGTQPVAAAASAQVQRIIEAAEATAEQMRTEAGEEARGHVERVSAAAGELLERIEAMRDEAGRLVSELQALERGVGEIGAAAEPGAPAADAAPAAAEVAAPPAAELTPPPAAEPAGADPAISAAAEPDEASAGADTRPDDEEAARIVALDMALGGTPREETGRYLAEHYALADPDSLLDDVYALAGS